MDRAELIRALADTANRMRIESIRSTTAAGSGHPTTACSAADVMATLFFSEMRLDVADPRNPNADRFILSKGHGAPVLYAAWAEAGRISQSELLTLRKLDSPLQGHPTPVLDFVDVATGSLGQGLSVGLGVALAQGEDASGARTFVLCGDAEIAEGSVWEAVNVAGHYGIGNLVCIVDVNGLGQSGETMYGHDVAAYVDRFGAFGWHALPVDGHDIEALLEAYDVVRAQAQRPTVLLARTLKGKGIPFAEGKNGWHGKPLTEEQAAEAIVHIEGLGATTPAPPPREAPAGEQPGPISPVALPPLKYALGDKVATRKAFGETLAAIGGLEPRVVVVDGDVQNSTYTQDFGDAYPARFHELFIAEQNMLGVGTGQAVMGRVPFVSTFAAFLARAFDQVRLAGISGTNLKLNGSHAGVSIGEDGPSQMGLEDLAMMQAVPDCTVLYPTDAVATARATELATNHQGMVYVRTSRPATEVLYPPDETFEIGRAKVLRSSGEDAVTVVAAGVTAYEALAAADELAGEGIHVRVVDAFSVRPLDADLLRRCVAEVGDAFVTVEDHYASGGLGDAVLSALAEARVRLVKLAVEEIPCSGKPAELLDRFGISARHVVAAIRGLLGG